MQTFSNRLLFMTYTLHKKKKEKPDFIVYFKIV